MITVASRVSDCRPDPEIPTSRQLPRACLSTLLIRQMCLMASTKKTRFILSAERSLYSLSLPFSLDRTCSRLVTWFYRKSPLLKLQKMMPVSLNTSFRSSPPKFRSDLQIFIMNSSKIL